MFLKWRLYPLRRKKKKSSFLLRKVLLLQQERHGIGTRKAVQTGQTVSLGDAIYIRERRLQGRGLQKRKG